MWMSNIIKLITSLYMHLDIGYILIYIKCIHVKKYQGDNRKLIYHSFYLMNVIDLSE